MAKNGRKYRNEIIFKLLKYAKTDPAIVYMPKPKNGKVNMSYEVSFKGESSYDQLWCNFDVAGQGDSISKATLKHPHSQLDKIIKTVSELIIEKNNKELEHFLQTNLKTLTDCHKNIVDCQEQISRFDAEKYFNSLEFLKKEAEYDLKAIEYLKIVQVNLQIRKAEKISNSIARKIKKIFS